MCQIFRSFCNHPHRGGQPESSQVSLQGVAGTAPKLAAQRPRRAPDRTGNAVEAVRTGGVGGQILTRCGNTCSRGV